MFLSVVFAQQYINGKVWVKTLPNHSNYRLMTNTRQVIKNLISTMRSGMHQSWEHQGTKCLAVYFSPQSSPDDSPLLFSFF